MTKFYAPAGTGCASTEIQVRGSAEEPVRAPGLLNPFRHLEARVVSLVVRRGSVQDRVSCHDLNGDRIAWPEGERLRCCVVREEGGCRILGHIGRRKHPRHGPLDLPCRIANRQLHRRTRRESADSNIETELDHVRGRNQDPVVAGIESIRWLQEILGESEGSCWSSVVEDSGNRNRCCPGGDKNVEATQTRLTNRHQDIWNRQYRTCAE